VYEAPLLVIRDGRVIHLADPTAVREHLGGLMAAYAESGAARAEIAELDVVDLGRSSAFATVHWHVRERDADRAMVKDFPHDVPSAPRGRKLADPVVYEPRLTGEWLPPAGMEDTLQL
jgi:hypothetical protein